MATVPSELPELPLVGHRGSKGPVTVARQRRTLAIFLALCALGALPALLGAPAGWQAAGLGLWLPGAGFLATGGWSLLLIPLTLLLFAASVVAWFWAGMVVAPVGVWLGAAALAGALAGDAIWPGAHAVAAASIAGIGVAARSRIRKRRQRDVRRARTRAEFLPASLGEVRERAARAPDAASREIAADDLPSLRYVLDRALQPLEEWNGFDVIEQFQPAALRYQLNHMGFVLGIAQGAYTPNFHGYMHEAQRNLIEKYRLRKVWGYWVWESRWGHLNFTDFDPAARDNIMLTGWFGMHVGQYMLNTGDRRYAEEGSLSFRLDDRTTYRHDFHSLIGSIVANYTRHEEDFCLYPCEPNWIYPICNHYGMTALATHDRLFGSGWVDRFLPAWLEKLDAEFTDASGSIIGLRSQLTGLEFPFPVGEAGYASFAHCFAPERARGLWAIARREVEPALGKDADGELRINLPGRGLDVGNYRYGHTPAYAGILCGAREFGDEELALAAQRTLDRDCGLRLEAGVRRYLGGSNLANISAAQGRLMRTGDFRRSFVEGPSEATLGGPVLGAVPYADVSVARAWSGGEDLDLTLYSTGAQTRQTLAIERLRPGKAYRVEGTGAPPVVTADALGRARLELTIAGRTAVRLVPS